MACSLNCPRAIISCSSFSGANEGYPGLEREQRIVQGEHRVRRHRADETPRLQLTQDFLVVAGKDAIDLVISAHGGSCACRLDRCSKPGIINLVERTLRNDFIDAGEIGKVSHPIRILVISGEVLDHRDDMLFLNRRNFSGRHAGHSKMDLRRRSRRIGPSARCA